MIKEITVEKAFDIEMPPDGSRLMTLDGYQGCQLQCPYCFQMNNKEWCNNILIRTNIVQALKKELAETTNLKEIFVGSQSDPYMPLEEEYKLTRSLLEFLEDKDYKIYITTKANNRLILRDKELLKSFKKPVTIVMGLANINEVHKGANNSNIAVANELAQAGIQTDVHITPILPYIMNVDEMIEAVDEKIFIYLDKLRIFTEGGQDQKILEWVRKSYPQYIKQYEKIILAEENDYYDELVARYKDNQRVNFLFV